MPETAVLPSKIDGFDCGSRRAGESEKKLEPDTRMTVRVGQINSEAELFALKDEWNPLLRASRSDTLFLTWEWISTWWQIYGGRSLLYVLVARSSDGRLIGLAPLQRVRRWQFGVWPVRVLQFIGDGGDVTPEYLDFVIERGAERPVGRAFIDYICADPTIQVIDLRPFSSHSPNFSLTELALCAHPGRLRSSQDSICTTLDLPDSLEEFLAGRSRNYRKKIGEYERRCERDLRIRLRVSTTAEELERDMTALISLHQKRWRRQSRAFQSVEYVEFHWRMSRLALDRGWMRLFSLETHSTPVALLYCFAYGGRYYFYQAGRDPSFSKHRVGLVLMHKVIQEAIKEGASVFDFLRGNEDYKYRWATRDLRNTRLVYSKGVNLTTATAARLAIGRMLVGS